MGRTESIFAHPYAQIVIVWGDIMSAIAAELTMKNAAMSFVRDRRGATAIEYGLIVACIVIVIIVALDFVGEESSANFNNVANTMENAIN